MFVFCIFVLATLMIKCYQNTCGVIHIWYVNGCDDAINYNKVAAFYFLISEALNEVSIFLPHLKMDPISKILFSFSVI
jgi:hypothetical protein